MTAEQVQVYEARFSCSKCTAIVSTQGNIPQKCLCGSTEFKLIAFSEDHLRMCLDKLRESSENIVSILSKYVDISEDSKKIISLWIVGTYLHKSYSTYPYLFFNAMKGSGKTRILKIISGLSKNGKMVANLSESVLFRSAANSTICLDEAEQIGGKEKQTLRELLNSAYKKGATAERIKKVSTREGDRFEVEKFDLYSPICLANINGMESILSDRCLSLILEKSSNTQITRRIEDFDSNPVFDRVRRELSLITPIIAAYLGNLHLGSAWNDYLDTLDTLDTLGTLPTQHTQDTQPTFDTQNLIGLFEEVEKTGIDGRNLELTFPLLIIAYLTDRELFKDVLRISSDIVMSKKKRDFDDSYDVLLYRFVADQDRMYKPVKELTEHFRLYVGTSPDWVNPTWLGKALHRLVLVEQEKREASGMLVLLNVEKAKSKLPLFSVGSVGCVSSVPKKGIGGSP